MKMNRKAEGYRAERADQKPLDGPKEKAKLQTWKSKEDRGSLFGQTQKRLTLRYSWLISLFLLLFAGIIYMSLYIMIWSNQEQRLNEMLNEEIHALEGPLYNDVIDGKFDKPGEHVFPLSSDQAFYYLIDPSGRKVTGAEIQKELGDQALALILADMSSAPTFRQIELKFYSVPLLHKKEEKTGWKRGTYMLGSRVLYRDGQVVGSLYAGKDVSFQKQLFQWLLLLLMGVAFVFLVLTVWLGRIMSSQAMLPIRQSYIRQQQFVADASHELRTPLSILLSSIEALDMEYPAEENTFAQHVRQGMKEEIQRMRKLSDDLLLLARSDSKQMELYHDWVDISDLVMQTVARMEPQARTQQIRLEPDIPETLRIRLDSEKVTRLLVILLENAIKYNTPGGSVKLTVSQKTSQQGNVVILEVCDTGIGIPEKELLHIFERFYRVDRQRSRQTGGHGLGLSIAKQITQGFGGTIQVQSVLGKGSVFRVELPLPKTD